MLYLYALVLICLISSVFLVLALCAASFLAGWRTAKPVSVTALCTTVDLIEPTTGAHLQGDWYIYPALPKAPSKMYEFGYRSCLAYRTLRGQLIIKE